MTTILEMLVKTLIERFAAAGFDVPDAMTQKQRESFVFQALEDAAIVPAESIGDSSPLAAKL